ncbi:hypothetical protein P4O66_010383, partial [Electrophorus voltai]
VKCQLLICVLNFVLLQMEDEVSYSTVIFNRAANVEPEAPVRQAEDVVYSLVMSQGEAPSNICTETTGEPTAAANGPSTPYRRATICLGLLCLLLLAGLVAVCVFDIIQISKYSTLLALYTDESTAHQRLQAAKVSLERDNKELTEKRDQLNGALRFIIQFSRFPANAFCHLTDGEIHCEPCLKHWIQYGSSCYFFYTGDYNLQTWQKSREHCMKTEGDLAVIDNTEEQAFINQHTPYYNGYHGYWIGLSRTNEKQWVWPTGRVLEAETG